ncbi:MAG: helix-turn-helix domain-containing protein [Haloferacaceae archaeon]
MSTIAQVRIPVDEFALKQTLPRVPDVTVEVTRLVAHETPHFMPFLWAIGDDLGGFEEALDQDETVDNVERLTEFEGERFYRMDWTSAIDLLTHTLIHDDAAILNARGHADAWHLRLLFQDRDSFGSTRQYCEEQGLQFDIEQVYRLTRNNQRTHGLFGLTEQQYTCLINALEEGYYEVPRETSARALADELGVSHQAVSERLRRGHRNLISNALVTAPYHEPTSEE